MQNKKTNCIAVCLFGLEATVSYELKNLGLEVTKVSDGRVHFKAEPYEVAKANLCLRTAERVLIHLGSYRAQTFEELYRGMLSLDFERYLTKDCKFPVARVRSLKSALHSIPDIQSVSKKAIVERLKSVYKGVHTFSETGVEYPIHLFLHKDVVEVTIDTTGMALHKRGYRERSGEAPIRETLAAFMVMLTPWNKDRVLLDPMCGSGTIAIEAAMIGANIQPGVNRNFIGEEFEFLPKEEWVRARKEAVEGERSDVQLWVYASDIDPEMIKLAKENADLAGVADLIHFEVKDIKDLNLEQEYGFMITNPPYGLRIGDEKNLRSYYRELGRLSKRLKNWSYYVITTYSDIESHFEKKADKKRNLYNGKQKTVYYQFLGERPPKEYVFSIQNE
ncbi:MAG: class I SAM-dependent RNA methyltransferase [Filifactor alocis]|nr:class I SAM-dependent RNA methyltransferase [Filifactor alocis]